MAGRDRGWQRYCLSPGARRPRARCERAAVIFGVGSVYEDGVNAPCAQRQVELGVRAPVEAARRDKIVARTQQRHHGCHLRRHARRGSHRACSTLQRGYALFKSGCGRVHNTGIDIAEALQGKKMSGMVGVVKDKRCRLVDGDCPRSCGGVGSLSRVDRERIEAKDVIAVDFWHGVCYSCAKLARAGAKGGVPRPLPCYDMKWCAKRV